MPSSAPAWTNLPTSSAGFGGLAAALGGPAFGAPALAGAGGPGLFGGGPHLPAAPRRMPDTSYLVGGSGAAPVLPARSPAGLRPATTGGPDGRAPRPGRGARRDLGPITGRLAVAAVAAGALASAGHSLATSVDAPATETRADLALSAASGADDSGTRTDSSWDALDAATSGVMAVAAPTDTRTATAPARDAGQVSSLSKARQKADTSARETAEREAAARAPQFVKPAQGTFTSGFGSRWGTSHLGIDIANSIGTPIVTVADGTVLESGPASGFGMWVRVQLDDGTINVYGHINRSYVSEGQKVKAGEEIAEIGNRGQSTGPHLHFEVWTSTGKKINPLPWLAERGISLGSGKD